MTEIVLIAIITACGLPVSSYFYDSEAGHVMIIDVDNEEMMELSLDKVQNAPHLEIDIAYLMDLNCS